MNAFQDIERYSRHISLKEFGEAGQEKISNAKVLVVGAGGLGCPVLQYLAAAGVGTIGIADDDVVSLSNLHRQVLYTTADVGSLKAMLAADRLKQLNPDITVHTHCAKVDASNALELMGVYDIIVDGTDNFATRYLVNDACALLNKPLVFGGIYKYEGQVAVFNVRDENGEQANYRHLFPQPPSAEEAPGCQETGVLNVLPGIIGMLQATEAIKLITGMGRPLINRLLTYNVLTAQSYVINLTAYSLPEGLLPTTKEAFMNTNYEWLCGEALKVDAERFTAFLTDEETLLIDVREPGELPEADFPHISMPLSQINDQAQTISDLNKKRIVLFCQSGPRSYRAAAMLRKFTGDREIYTLAGGLQALKSYQHA